MFGSLQALALTILTAVRALRHTSTTCFSGCQGIRAVFGGVGTPGFDTWEPILRLSTSGTVIPQAANPSISIKKSEV